MLDALAGRTLTALIAVLALGLGGCAPLEELPEEPEPVYVPPEAVAEAERDPSAPPVVEEQPSAETPPPGTVEKAPEPSVTEPPAAPPPATPPAGTPPSVPPPPAGSAPPDSLGDVVVKAKPRGRHEEIRDLVAEAQALLKNVELSYVFTGRGRREALRGRPVAFALWSESKKQWTIAHVEIPRPPVRWKPGGRPLPIRVVKPAGITARHVRGTGAERLMVSFAKGGEPLRVYGRKFPVFDNAHVARKRWRAAVAGARPIVYLPFTEDTLDPRFVDTGREFLLSTARRAIDELRAAGAPSRAFPGRLLADVVPAELIAALAVIEQTDDAEYLRRRAGAFDDVLSQYGLKREDAFRYSVSRARAMGAMQFTNRRGNGTYSLVVRMCPAAKLDPVFERGATDIYNSMKAAICLFDIELWQMRPEIRNAYWDNQRVLGIFPMAAYNGGPRNVARLNRVIQQMRLRLDDLRPPGVLPPDATVSCPCLWAEDGDEVRPVSIPRYNNENRWYVQKYQTVMGLLEQGGGAGPAEVAR